MEPGDGLDDLTSPGSAVGTDGARTEALDHLGGFDHSAVRAPEERRVIVGAELDIDQVLFPANWAFASVLRAH